MGIINESSLGGGNERGNDSGDNDVNKMAPIDERFQSDDGYSGMNAININGIGLGMSGMNLGYMRKVMISIKIVIMNVKWTLQYHNQKNIGIDMEM